jgi:hypothetical protein
MKLLLVFVLLATAVLWQIIAIMILWNFAANILRLIQLTFTQAAQLYGIIFGISMGTNLIASLFKAIKE